MAITAYTGLMGHGKTYEVTEGPVVDGVKSGRTVAAYIDGIQPELIKEYVIEKYKLEPEKVGEVVLLTREQVESPMFYPAQHVQNPIVKPGWLVIIDEAQKFYGADMQLHANWKEFFTEHRHYVDENTGVACDIVLITQDIQNIHKFLRNLIELTFLCKKLKTLGLHSRYTISWWEGAKKMYSYNKVGSQTKKYNKEIFPLYKSYAGTGKGKELNVDDRQNIFKSPVLWMTTAGVIAMLYFGGTGAYKFFHRNDAVQTTEKAAATAGATNTANSAQAAGSSKAQTPAQTKRLRLVGYYSVDERAYAIVQSDDGQLQYTSVGGGAVLDSVRTAIPVNNTVATFSSATAQQQNNKTGGLFK